MFVALTDYEDSYVERDCVIYSAKDRLTLFICQAESRWVLNRQTLGFIELEGGWLGHKSHAL